MAMAVLLEPTVPKNNPLTHHKNHLSFLSGFCLPTKALQALWFVIGAFCTLTSMAAELGATDASVAINDNQTNSIDEKVLLANPALFNDILSQVIDRGDIRALQILTPVYETLADKDDILYLYALAVLNEPTNPKQATEYYHKILTLNPNLTPIRTRLILSILTIIRFTVQKLSSPSYRLTPPYPAIF